MARLVFFFKAVKENLFHACLPASGRLLAILAFLGLQMHHHTSALRSHGFSQCVFLCTNPSDPFCKDTSHTGLEAHLTPV